MAYEFDTIAVSDGISMGSEGMRASLVSRDWIADSVKLVMRAQGYDGFLAIAGCDKSIPGMLMAMVRLDHFHSRRIFLFYQLRKKSAEAG